jgi:uncharacterized phage protein gp47/JayE
MFEDKNKETIHSEMMESVSDDYDKSVGSFIYDSTMPTAMKLEEAYKSLGTVTDKLSVENLEGDELSQRIYERSGVERKPATFASTVVTVTGQAGTVINIGDKISSDTVNYSFMESKTIDSSGTAEVLVQCDEAGIVGNVPANSIQSFPVTIQGLTSVTNKEPVTNGYAAESDEELLKRYYERIQTPATSGNKAHYKNWAKEVTGVGDARIFPLWNGDNTVKVVIIDSNKGPAAAELVEEVQTHIDPDSLGLGEGAAPIGAYCTVESASGLTINLSFTATKDTAFTDEQIRDSVEQNIGEYLKELAFTDSQVSYARIGSLVLASDGILDYTDLRVNDGASNILVSDTEVPVLGVITFD